MRTPTTWIRNTIGMDTFAILLLFCFCASIAQADEGPQPPQRPTTFVEMLSENAITFQCEIFATGAGSAYATMLTNPHLTADDATGIQLTLEIMLALFSTENFSFETLLYKDTIPAPNIEYFITNGVSFIFMLLNSPNFAEEMSEVNPDIEIQANYILQISQAQCYSDLTEHLEIVHGGVDPCELCGPRVTIPKDEIGPRIEI